MDCGDSQASTVNVRSSAYQAPQITSLSARELLNLLGPAQGYGGTGSGSKAFSGMPGIPGSKSAGGT